MRTEFAALLGLALSATPSAAQFVLVPMDLDQNNHLKAYGLTFWTIKQGSSAEWLLNYRNGSFLLPDQPEVRREAALRGVTSEPISAVEVSQIRVQIEDSNMESIILEKAPKIAVYTPGNTNPWDDAVTLALMYADIPYEKVWDPEVLQGRLSEYDWLHLHHEDFTGQYSKFYINYAGAPWLQDAVRQNEAIARQFSQPNVPALKKAVAEEIRRYVADGGFLFAMCTATETIELALAAMGVDIAAAFSDGTGIDPDASRKLQWDRTLAFRGAEVQINPGVNAFSDIDGHQVNTPWRQPLGVFELFEFAAKFDPVPSMLVQNHETVIGDFYGLTTSFRKDRLKPGTLLLADEEGTSWVKYVHGTFGEGTWTFLGGHDPEDPQHQIGDAPTDLSLHPHSAGYRLILNNVLFPAAKKKTLKTQ
ncbi:MAG: asparagine synthetase B [Gemmatimonadetes bacterium]|nr:asparagine synthetase B [Gemmatimonadota bacterium]